MAGWTTEQAYGEQTVGKELDVLGTRAVRVPYSEEVGDAICMLLASGRSLNWICKQKGMPTRWAVYQWLLDPGLAHFRAKYKQAREDQVESLVDEIPDIADDASNDFMEGKNGYRVNDEHIRRSQIRIEARKWIAERMQPRKYGPSAELRLKDPDGVAKPTIIQVVAAQPKTIEHDPAERVPSEPVGDADLFEPVDPAFEPEGFEPEGGA